MLKPRGNSIPQQTQQIARQAFPKGNLFMQMRDELGEIFFDQEFNGLYPLLANRPGAQPG